MEMFEQNYILRYLIVLVGGVFVITWACRALGLPYPMSTVLSFAWGFWGANEFLRRYG